ncbi:uncharacterized protein [Spinacia oleracea]|uniref:Uncharacterized protein isoform X2 n=1 Tax=Spinacia oleracea TaxID=3562 RepID=A0A9R0JWB3_SPIOL|nr:uncharacterized protein LOC110788614 isoform X2 [Spinacia oleracea]
MEGDNQRKLLEDVFGGSSSDTDIEEFMESSSSSHHFPSTDNKRGLINLSHSTTNPNPSWKHIADIKGLWLCRDFLSLQQQSSLLSSVQTEASLEQKWDDEEVGEFPSTKRFDNKSQAKIVEGIMNVVPKEYREFVQGPDDAQLGAIQATLVDLLIKMDGAKKWHREVQRDLKKQVTKAAFVQIEEVRIEKDATIAAQARDLAAYEVREEGQPSED